MVVVLLFEHHYFVFSFFQEAAWKVECLLWSAFPIASKVEAINEDYALAPGLHVEKGVAGGV